MQFGCLCLRQNSLTDNYVPLLKSHTQNFGTSLIVQYHQSYTEDTSTDVIVYLVFR